MKRFLLIAKFLLAGATATLAQSVGINTTGSQPNASSILDVSSTSKGLLIPRMTAAQRTAIASPAKGLLVFQDDVVSSFFYYDGSAWAPITSAAAAVYTAGTGIDITGTVLSAKNTTALWNAAQLQGKDISTTSPLNGQVMTYSGATNNWMPTTPGSANLTGWSTTGNAAINPATNFIGTTDAQPFIGKANGAQVFRFSPTGTTTLVGFQAGNADPTGAVENHFIGYQAGYNITSGFDNQFEGYQAGYKNTAGYSNQFIGFKAGYSNLTGTDNFFVGQLSGYSNLASNNHFVGAGAGFANTTGTNNYFSGRSAGSANTIGARNTYIGKSAGSSNQSGDDNTIIGYEAGLNSLANYNQFIGFQAGSLNTSGVFNHFNGYRAGFTNTTGSNNHFDGYQSGVLNTTGEYNTFVGNQAGYSNGIGGSNLAFGYKAGFNNTVGSNNIFHGLGSGFKNVSGNNNTYIGQSAGHENISGSGNVALGNYAGYYETGSNKLYISNSLTTTPLLYGEFDNQKLDIGGTVKIQKFVTSGTPMLEFKGTNYSEYQTILFTNTSTANNWSIQTQVGPRGEGFGPYSEMIFNTAQHADYSIVPLVRFAGTGNAFFNGNVIEVSDKRFKKNIAPLENSLESLLKINGYTYNWIEKSKTKTKQIGFIAQELEKVFPELVETDKDGWKSVAYTHIIPVLVESIKEQQTMIDDLKTENTQLKKDIAAIKVKLGL